MNIEEQLRTEMKVADGYLPGGALSWPGTIARARRQRHSHLAVSALAGSVAFVAVAMGAVALLKPASIPSTTPPDRTVGPVQQAVRSWIESIAEGNLKSAWRQIGPASKGKFGTFEQFRTAATSQLQSVWAPWAETRPDVYLTPVTSTGVGPVVVATVADPMDQEATGGPATQSLVVSTDGEARVEPAVGQYPIEVIMPKLGKSMPPDAVLRAKVTKSTAVIFDVVDLPGVQGEGVLDGRDPAGLLATRWRPPEPLPRGRHVLTVVSITAQGPVDTASIIFEID